MKAIYHYFMEGSIEQVTMGFIVVAIVIWVIKSILSDD